MENINVFRMVILQLDVWDHSCSNMQFKPAWCGALHPAGVFSVGVVQEEFKLETFCVQQLNFELNDICIFIDVGLRVGVRVGKVMIRINKVIVENTSD